MFERSAQVISSLAIARSQWVVARSYRLATRDRFMAPAAQWERSVTLADNSWHFLDWAALGTPRNRH
jgi:hypothetical protein